MRAIPKVDAESVLASHMNRILLPNPDYLHRIKLKILVVLVLLSAPRNQMKMKRHMVLVLLSVPHRVRGRVVALLAQPPARVPNLGS